VDLHRRRPQLLCTWSQAADQSPRGSSCSCSQARDLHRRHATQLLCTWSQARDLLRDHASAPALAHRIGIFTGVQDASSFVPAHKMWIFTDDATQLLCTCSQAVDLHRRRDPAPLYLVTSYGSSQTARPQLLCTWSQARDLHRHQASQLLCTRSQARDLHRHHATPAPLYPFAS
jgi:hypothetical protein